jgi:hypothetical protein
MFVHESGIYKFSRRNAVDGSRCDQVSPDIALIVGLSDLNVNLSMRCCGWKLGNLIKIGIIPYDVSRMKTSSIIRKDTGSGLYPESSVLSQNNTR